MRGRGQQAFCDDLSLVSCRIVADRYHLPLMPTATFLTPMYASASSQLPSKQHQGDSRPTGSTVEVGEKKKRKKAETTSGKGCKEEQLA